LHAAQKSAKACEVPKNDFGGWAPWSLFLNFFEIDILKFFKKFDKKILGVDNDVVYGPAKSQREMFCIQPCTKITNTDGSDCL
jgi:hypothetical protein